MAEKTEGSIEIEARPEEILEVIADYESYPEWVDGIRSAEVVDRDARGRGTEVAFEFAAMGFTASYTLTYDYADDGSGVSWTTKEASGAVRDVSGEYVLEVLNGDTEVTYRLAVDLAVPVPRFVKRRADRAATRTALEGLKRRVEG
ncbi:MAG TPA: SRPBCC family protein [Actinomycetota bacterium]|nr:SRPBCC family protein [Actinomycetota bacterium]